MRLPSLLLTVLVGCLLSRDTGGKPIRMEDTIMTIVSRALGGSDTDKTEALSLVLELLAQIDLPSLCQSITAQHEGITRVDDIIAHAAFGFGVPTPASVVQKQDIGPETKPIPEEKKDLPKDSTQEQDGEEADLKHHYNTPRPLDKKYFTEDPKSLPDSYDFLTKLHPLPQEYPFVDTVTLPEDNTYDFYDLNENMLYNIPTAEEASSLFEEITKHGKMDNGFSKDATPLFFPEDLLELAALPQEAKDELEELIISRSQSLKPESKLFADDLRREMFEMNNGASAPSSANYDNLFSKETTSVAENDISSPSQTSNSPALQNITVLSTSTKSTDVPSTTPSMSTEQLMTTFSTATEPSTTTSTPPSTASTAEAETSSVHQKFSVATANADAQEEPEESGMTKPVRVSNVKDNYSMTGSKAWTDLFHSRDTQSNEIHDDDKNITATDVATAAQNITGADVARDNVNSTDTTAAPVSMTSESTDTTVLSLDTTSKSAPLNITSESAHVSVKLGSTILNVMSEVMNVTSAVINMTSAPSLMTSPIANETELSGTPLFTQTVSDTTNMYDSNSTYENTSASARGKSTEDKSVPTGSDHLNKDEETVFSQNQTTGQNQETDSESVVTQTVTEFDTVPAITETLDNTAVPGTELSKASDIPAAAAAAMEEASRQTTTSTATLEERAKTSKSSGSELNMYTSAPLHETTQMFTMLGSNESKSTESETSKSQTASANTQEANTTKPLPAAENRLVADLSITGQENSTMPRMSDVSYEDGTTSSQTASASKAYVGSKTAPVVKEDAVLEIYTQAPETNIASEVSSTSTATSEASEPTDFSTPLSVAKTDNNSYISWPVVENNETTNVSSTAHSSEAASELSPFIPETSRSESSSVSVDISETTTSKPSSAFFESSETKTSEISSVSMGVSETFTPESSSGFTVVSETFTPESSSGFTVVSETITPESSSGFTAISETITPEVSSSTSQASTTEPRSVSETSIKSVNASTLSESVSTSEPSLTIPEANATSEIPSESRTASQSAQTVTEIHIRPETSSVFSTVSEVTAVSNVSMAGADTSATKGSVPSEPRISVPETNTTSEPSPATVETKSLLSGVKDTSSKITPTTAKPSARKEDTTSTPDDITTTVQVNSKSNTTDIEQPTTAVSDGSKPAAVSDGSKPAAVSDGSENVTVSDGSESVTVSDGSESAAVSDGSESAAVSHGSKSAAVSDGSESLVTENSAEESSGATTSLSTSVQQGKDSQITESEITQDTAPLPDKLPTKVDYRLERPWWKPLVLDREVLMPWTDSVKPQEEKTEGNSPDTMMPLERLNVWPGTEVEDKWSQAQNRLAVTSPPKTGIARKMYEEATTKYNVQTTDQGSEETQRPKGMNEQEHKYSQVSRMDNTQSASTVSASSTTAQSQGSGSADKLGLPETSSVSHSLPPFRHGPSSRAWSPFSGRYSAPNLGTLWGIHPTTGTQKYNQGLLQTYNDMSSPVVPKYIHPGPKPLYTTQAKRSDLNEVRYKVKDDHSEISDEALKSLGVQQRTLWSAAAAADRLRLRKEGYACPGLFGYFGDLMDCRSFFICSWGVPFRFHCPSGTLWNPRESVCDWARNVQCPK